MTSCSPTARAAAGETLPIRADDQSRRKQVFKVCLDGGKYGQAIHTDLSEERKLGVTGTPAFILGICDSRQVKDAVIIRGAVPYSAFKAELDTRLSETPEEKR